MVPRSKFRVFSPRSRLGLRLFLPLAVGLMLISAVDLFGQEQFSKPDRDQQLEAFLKDDTVAAFEILAEHPDFLKERTVQVKVYRSQRSKDPEMFAAAYRLCFQVPDLAGMAPMIERRCNGAFIGSDPAPRRLMLELALEDADLKQDLRVVGLINSVLHSEDEPLRNLGRQMLESYPALGNLPAILEALPESAGTLPDYESFKATVNPVFTAMGPDERACINCHNSRPILFFPQLGPDEEEEPVIRQRYRSVLRVIDLENPEASLILNKPTNPAPENPKGPSSPAHHIGGPRFQKGDETYNRILRWITGSGERPEE